MSDDNFYDDDDFYSDHGGSSKGNSPRSASPRGKTSPRMGSPRGGGPIMAPIVEVPTPSESNTALNSARSDDDGPDTQRTASTDHISDDESEDETPRSPRTRSPRSARRPTSGRKSKKYKSKVMNGRHHVDMTPPDIHLKKAERKAKKYLEKSKVDQAIKELVRCTALARIVYGDGHWKLAESYTKLAEGYLDLKGYAPQAQYHADFAKSIMMSSVQMSDSSNDKPLIMGVLLNIYYTLGRALTALKKYSEAEQSLNRADKLAKERAKISTVKRKDTDKWKIKLYLAIAKLGARQQKYAVATTNFEKALDMMENVYSRDGVELIPVYQSLGKVEQSKGGHADHEKAIEHYLQAHSIASANYKDNSIHVAETARQLAMAYSNVGNDDAETSAESYLNDCLSIYQGLYGPNHESTIEVESELARLMIRTDRQEEGLKLLKSGIEAKTEVYGDFSSEVSETWKLMGNVYLAQGDTEKALRSLKKCHIAECALYGSNNKKTKDTQRTIDLLMANPNLSSKLRKTKADELKERPRFSSVVSRSKPVGQCKVPDY